MNRVADKPLSEYPPQVGVLWRSRNEELDAEEFDCLPGWMNTDPLPSEDLADVQRIVGECMADGLTKREMLVIRMRFWSDLTLEECAERLGVTSARARQLEIKALRKLRHREIRTKLSAYSLWSAWYQWAQASEAMSQAEKRIARLRERSQYPTDKSGYCISL